jgi:hypothetical protein
MLVVALFTFTSIVATELIAASTYKAHREYFQLDKPATITDNNLRKDKHTCMNCSSQ